MESEKEKALVIVYKVRVLPEDPEQIKQAQDASDLFFRYRRLRHNGGNKIGLRGVALGSLNKSIKEELLP